MQKKLSLVVEVFCSIWKLSSMDISIFNILLLGCFKSKVIFRDYFILRLYAHFIFQLIYNFWGNRGFNYILLFEKNILNDKG